MSISAQELRFSTAQARQSLARRLNLPLHDHMQDWEWEVADAARLQEFLDLYEYGVLSESERFSLMEIILQSVEDSPGALDENPHWARTLVSLKRNLPLHFSSVEYWALIESSNAEEPWRITPALRMLLGQHSSQRSPGNA